MSFLTDNINKNLKDSLQSTKEDELKIIDGLKRLDIIKEFHMGENTIPTGHIGEKLNEKIFFDPTRSKNISIYCDRLGYQLQHNYTDEMVLHMLSGENLYIDPVALQNLIQNPQMFQKQMDQLQINQELSKDTDYDGIPDYVDREPLIPYMDHSYDGDSIPDRMESEEKEENRD